MLAWALLPALALMQFFDLRTGLHGRPEMVSAFLVGFGAVAVVCLPFLLRRGVLTRVGMVALGSFSLLLCWAVWSAATTVLPRVFRPRVVIGREYLLVPLATAAVTMLAAWGLAAAVPARLRERLLWWSSVLVAGTTLVAGPRYMLANDTMRLGTGMGGPAIFHMVLLLCLGVLLRAALEGRRRVWSLAGSMVCLVGILLTGSRSGLLCLVCFVALVGLLFALRGQARLVAPLVGVAAGVLAAVLAFVPSARRLLQSSDFGRTTNAETAWRVFTQDAHSMVLGVGSGRMWPWYAFETGLAPTPWRGIISTGYGRGTTNPHSVLLGVMVELGLVGLLVLAVCLGAVVWAAVAAWRAADRSPGAATAVVPLLAVLATLPAMLFDHYLFKNYAVSFWWWFTVATLLGIRPGLDDTPTTKGTAS